MSQQTLAIIKPDAAAQGRTGAIISAMHEHGFTIRAMQQVYLSTAQARGFYAVHAQKPFFDALVSFMTSGPCVVLVLEKQDAIAAWREVMGATDPARAADGTLRSRFGTDVTRNACHGSDSPENAEKEIAFFFSGAELLSLSTQRG